MDAWKGSEYASEYAFIFKSIWISKVTDNLLLGKSKQKESNKLQNSSTKMLLKLMNHDVSDVGNPTLSEN